MIRKISVILLLFACIASLGWTGWWKKDTAEPVVEARSLSWDDLIPESWVPPANPLNNMTQEQIDKLFDGSEESNRELREIEEILMYAPVEPSLDGLVVTIPGYVVPLEFDEATLLEEFLIVPYMGACIHTPPPPANQVVYAHSDKAIEIESMYVPVVVTGRMKTETVQKQLAEAGYMLEVLKVEPYEQTQ